MTLTIRLCYKVDIRGKFFPMESKVQILYKARTDEERKVIWNGNQIVTVEYILEVKII